MKTWAIRLSNLHPNLIEVELSIFFNNFHKLVDFVYLVHAEEETIEFARQYSSLFRFILEEPLTFDAVNIQEPDKKIIKTLSQTNSVNFDKDTVCVRMQQIGKRNKDIISEEVERIWANSLYREKSFKADLKYPDKTLKIFMQDKKCVVGWIKYIIEFDEVQIRAPVNSPYYGGGALKPHLSRLLTNMHHPHSIIILDPFCGHGGILREIASMGTTALGLEINFKILKENLANCKFHKLDTNIHLIAADAINPPLRKNCIEQGITDPPYGIQSTTIGRDRDKLILDWMQLQTKAMQLVLSTPVEMLSTTPSDWKILIDETDYVHRTLTRRIRKLIKCKN